MALEEIIKQKLNAEFAPEKLEVINESHKHAGHAGSPGTGESHFHIYIVSEKFKGLSRVEIHRQINNCLSEELQTKIHALSIKALSKMEI